MRHRIPALLVVALAGPLACGGSASPAPAASPAPFAVASTPPAPVVPPPPSVQAPPPAPAPTPEEKKKAEARRQLEEDRAKWQAEQKTELSRWTPELHAAAQALSDKTYPTGHAAIQAALAGKHRKPGDAERDKYRHPLATLDFFGFKPTMTVLEISPGEGWFTELLAPALHAKGKLLVTSGDPKGPEDERSTFNAQRYQAFLANAPELFGNVQTVIVDDKAPVLGADESVDLVMLMREAHGMVNNGTFARWLGAIHRALKPGGVLAVEDHRAPVGADPVESAKKGYLPEKWLIEQIEQAGFELGGKSEVNANPKDTKDYPEGVWTLPPSFRLGAKDHEKYAAIGESDRMTLKFIKGHPKPATPAPK